MSAVLPGTLREPRAAAALLLRRVPERRDALGAVLGRMAGPCGAGPGGVDSVSGPGEVVPSLVAVGAPGQLAPVRVTRAGSAPDGAG